MRDENNEDRDRDDRNEPSDGTVFGIAVTVSLAAAVLIFLYTEKMNRATGIMAVGVGIGAAWVAREASRRVRI